MGTILIKTTPILTDECLRCKDAFLQSLKTSIPEFAQEYNGVFYFTKDKTNELQTFIDNFTCTEAENVLQTIEDEYLEITKPYVEGVYPSFLIENTTEDIIIKGNNFDDTIELNIDNVTINSYTVNATEIKANVTANKGLSSSNISVTKCSIKNFGNYPRLTVIKSLIGDGPSGEFLTEFNNKTGNQLWGSEWTLEYFGRIKNADKVFKSSNTKTSSKYTGPSHSYDGTYYMYTESSNPNNGSGTYCQATTSNFRFLQSIEFAYHMYGVDINGLVIQSKSNGEWVDRFTLNGQQQTSSDDAWKESGVIDCTNWNAQAIRFVFKSPKGYRADIALDKIKIISS